MRWLTKTDHGFPRTLTPLSSHAETDGGGGSAVADLDAATAQPETTPQVRTPPMYRVLLMNDDFTPMDFVVHVLQKFFSKQMEEATKIMLEVHHKGAGTCGVFTHEIAETKVHLVNTYAKQNRFPLKCTMEKAEA